MTPKKRKNFQGEMWIRSQWWFIYLTFTFTYWAYIPHITHIPCLLHNAPHPLTHNKWRLIQTTITMDNNRTQHGVKYPLHDMSLPFEVSSQRKILSLWRLFPEWDVGFGVDSWIHVCSGPLSNSCKSTSWMLYLHSTYTLSSMKVVCYHVCQITLVVIWGGIVVGVWSGDGWGGEMRG